jgi:dipeptidyl aminopeptidase/acylaminoacyl peptidase
MGSPIRAPFGSWKSPISARDFAASQMLISETHLAGDRATWVEVRPQEAGRSVLVGMTPLGPRDITPPGYSVRSRVHEYGGGAYAFIGEAVIFSNFYDHRLYRQDPGRPLRPITPEPPERAGLRYADLEPSPDGRLVFCVRETHDARGVTNEMVAVPADGSAPPRSVLGGHDFFSSPRLSPDGGRLAWLTWEHPRLPWVGTELWVGEVRPAGAIRAPRKIAGGPGESITDPKWSPQGILHFVSDRTGWWNLYARIDGKTIPLAPMEAEFGYPQWEFGESRYAFLSGGRIVCAYTRDGMERLGLIQPASGRVETIETEVTSIQPPRLASDGEDTLVFVGGGPALGRSALRLRLGRGEPEVLRSPIARLPGRPYLSDPIPFTFRTGDGRDAHGIFYRPANPEFIGPPGERPPLLVEVHGGPTGMAPSYVDLEYQYFTSRGFALANINYGGSSGYGRAYRDRLIHQWGIVDVEDCLYAAQALAERGEVDFSRMAIRGGSAGGFTALRALTHSNLFSAGGVYFGVTDLEALDEEQHKFESKYNEWLVGPYPEARQDYLDRSPINAADRIEAPVILFQGLDDKVVLPSQAEKMVAALRRNRVPYAYLTFEGEGHGFRRAETHMRSIEAELAFYGKVFGFKPADLAEPIEIANMQAAR